ncbi:carboxypeptidase-like regulatory domain-containing protein [Hymenobacter busanensis]|uniref:Carboxypeptidase-like regulatory domain-containing protein n=1 Tax=Hymenobacter busanensis TaxID=2607656 RepID=A0A7L4ZZM1_9BACT|nr:DUF5686 and carboxypeptidase-like regulatory domain-containing protein [Hymenobacter busanensis]KAA9333029.1 carboxypeptidase-like regulatory domain-containing protein [Hymenobacter busanensis]QHJ08296.1 carboxypeptidase-like regulatory domain-containing protein [Hymenobacter busanensis]
MKSVYSWLGLVLLLTLGNTALAQRIVFSGRITEAATGQAVPFASVYVKGTTFGTTADEDGRYQLPVAHPVDSLWASAVGFRPKSVAAGKAPQQTLNVKLPSAAIALGEVTIRPTENPAYAILRQVQQHKKQNDKARLDAFEFDSYNRIEVSLSDISDRLARRKVIRDMTAIADGAGDLARNASGKPTVPLFASEVMSRYYVRHRPNREREEIKHSQLHGVAPQDGTLLSQVLGSSFQDYDFYPNWQVVMGKDFISPIADGWRITYDYDLEDSVMVGQDRCYQLKVTPRRPQDLAFTGRIWVTMNSYALRRVDLEVDPKANINFVDQIRVYQDLAPSPAGPWLPQRTRVVLGLKPTKKQSGLLVRFTTVNSQFDAGHPHELPFYDQPFAAAPNAQKTPADFWQQQRPDTLSAQEARTLTVLDSVGKLPSVRTFLEVADLVVNGYKELGPRGRFELGPIFSTYNYNNVEGNRLRLGFRTTPELNPNWLVQGYAAYGTRDGEFKYSLSADRIVSRPNWTVFSVKHSHELDLVALLDNDLALESPLFEAAARFGNIRPLLPLWRDVTSVTAQSDLFHNFTQKLTLRRQHFDPIYNFAYYTTPDRQPGAPTADQLTLTEVVVESRYAPGETLLQNQNRRYAVGLNKLPVFTGRYTLGVDGLLGSNLRYQKFNFTMTHSVQLGQLGRTEYIVDAGYIPSTVPYLVLKAHLGNESPIYTTNAYNLMNYSEFISDRYASLHAEHYFEGLFINAVPLLKKLDWRLVATGNLLYGGLGAANRQAMLTTDASGAAMPTFRTLGTTPYAEVGYGVENIFKFVRVDFIHRLTYRDLPGIKTFGVKVCAQFKL